MASIPRDDADETGVDSNDSEILFRPRPSQVTPALLDDDNNNDNNNHDDDDDDDNNEVMQHSGSKRCASSLPPRELFSQRQVVSTDAADYCVPGAKRSRRPPSPESTYTQLSSTQPAEYTQEEQGTVEEVQYESFFLVDEATQKPCHLISASPSLLRSTQQERSHTFSIGREPTSTIPCPQENKHFGRCHVKLDYDPITSSFSLVTDEKHSCWILRCGDWKEVEPSSIEPLLVKDSFRLLPIPKNKDIDRTCMQFTLQRLQGLSAGVRPVGTASFDHEYLKLLMQIKKFGRPQTNEKGPNWTIPGSYSFVVDLRSENNKNLLPLTTLRKMYQGRGAIIEALWYLRGEDNICFLQRQHQHFWDKQAKQNGWVGFNYGLLTNFEGFNQLEEKVIRKLIHGKSSRNMVCSLVNPNQKTVQNACTTGVQFAVSCSDSDKEYEYLDLTVHQRSSDIILGLPHDVVAWTTILHLVRREVHRRSGRLLHAGKLFFEIAAGGAHVYKLNQNAFDELLRRKPIPNVEPELIMDIDKSVSIFDFAQTYGDNKSTSSGYRKDLRAGVTSFDKMYPPSLPAEAELSNDSNTEQNKKKWVRVVGYDKYHGRIEIDQAG